MSALTVTTVRTDTIKSSDSAINSISIDSSGRTIASSQPAFYGYRAAGEVWENYGLTKGLYVYNFNIAVTNRGNCYDTGTGVFTCPIAGVYGVCPGGIMGQAGGYAFLDLYVNGVNRSANGVHGNTTGRNNYFHNSTVFMVRCNKNDRIDIRCWTNGAAIYAQGHSHCSIWLV